MLIRSIRREENLNLVATIRKKYAYKLGRSLDVCVPVNKLLLTCVKTDLNVNALAIFGTFSVLC